MTALTQKLTLVGSYCYARDARVGDFAYATTLLSKYRSQLPELVTHRFKLDEVSRAFEAAGDKKSGSIKVQIEP